MRASSLGQEEHYRGRGRPEGKCLQGRPEKLRRVVGWLVCRLRSRGSRTEGRVEQCEAVIERQVLDKGTG